MCIRGRGKIPGRCDDMLIIRGVNVFPSQIEEQLLSIDALAPHYYIEVRKEGHLDEIAINAELKPEVDPSQREAAAALLRHKIKSYIGISAQIAVHKTGTIPRSEGKAKRVIDHRKS